MKVFIDIETIPNQKQGALYECISNVKAPKNLKKPESIDKWLSDNKNEQGKKDWLKTSLDGNSGEIVVICFAVEDGDVIKLFRKIDESERDLIEKFCEKLEVELNSKAGDIYTFKPYFVGHNIINFDIPFLFKRFVINCVTPGFNFSRNSRHPSSMFDTMEAWEGFKGYVSMDEIAKVLKIKGKSKGMNGSDVWEEVSAGNYDKVVSYCANDVECVRNIYNRLNFLHGDQNENTNI